MIKLVVTDLDGTVVRRDGTTSIRVRQALAACRAAGMAICVATGRVRQAVPDLGQDYTICHGGTIIMQGSQIVHRTALSAGQAAQVWRWANETGVPAIFYAEEGWSANFRDEQTTQLARFLGTEPGGEPDREVPLARLRCPAAVLAQAFPELHVEEDGEWTYLRRTAADKGMALRVLLNLLHLRPDQVVCFGDDLNDLPMFAVGGRGVAVANARPELRARATEVVPSVEEDGVALWLEALLAG